VKKQQGISFLLIDMHAPGVTVKPIELISGKSHFCEVFFDNVRVPARQPRRRPERRLDGGQEAAEHEREAMSKFTEGGAPSHDALAAGSPLSRRRGTLREPVWRDRLAGVLMDSHAFALTACSACNERLWRAGRERPGIDHEAGADRAGVAKYELLQQLMGQRGMSLGR
jgi:acyl-CoA dehydrogenase